MRPKKPTNPNFKCFLAIIFIGLLLFSCAKNPFTGGRTLALVPNCELFPTAFAQYGTFLKENKVIKGSKEALMVTHVGEKIRHAAERWLQAKGFTDYLKDYNWEYNLVENKEINAWCMPGGKIVVYTGILPITLDEAGLATVLSHEVSHALANHGQQRMSAGVLQQAGVAGVAILTGDKSAQTQQLAMAAYAGFTQYGLILPFSRSHESEADRIGLNLMAIAGYNPEKAVVFWQRMAKQSDGNKPPEILSTHPSDETRIGQLQELIPVAKAEAAKFGVTFSK